MARARRPRARRRSARGARTCRRGGCRSPESSLLHAMSRRPDTTTEARGEMADDGERRGAVVFGARNLGRATIELLLARGWGVAGVARSDETLDAIGRAGALALSGDVTDPASVRGVLDEVRDAQG